ncbi:hypothetical protein NA56DRAFT_743397 [Hyaloscypha hepaticicola]|uniref:Uncharacterized protein n=1 Tax=Hyaloscypha hepaticicola TaxID=2082293 RepID=A0A2J6QL74_9HELO|nr:hypothetical protein NA56DRAFT_743397 [Hyaloscypha hepaticicola]
MEAIAPKAMAPIASSESEGGKNNGSGSGDGPGGGSSGGGSGKNPDAPPGRPMPKPPKRPNGEKNNDNPKNFDTIEDGHQRSVPSATDQGARLGPTLKDSGRIIDTVLGKRLIGGIMRDSCKNCS